MSNQALATLNLEAPNLALTVSENQLIKQEEEVVQQDVGENKLFIPGVNVPRLKKYYKK